MIDSLGDRIKKYEAVSKTSLMTNSPVIIRVDGKAFHTFSRGFEKPFDQNMISCMVKAAKYTAERMQGFKCAYVQSDEVTFVLTDYDTHETEGWFDYKLNKLVSTSAALMSVAFYNAMMNCDSSIIDGNLPTFDSRAFNVPREEVINTLLWRALDWKRNSVQMLAQHHFSHTTLMGKNQAQMKEMLIEVVDNWDDRSGREKYGTFILPSSKLSGFKEFYVEPTYDDIDMIMPDFNNLVYK